MGLTDVSIRKSKAAQKQYKLTDGRGLFLLVHPNGSKYWRMKYRKDGREKVLSLGKYPDVSLAKARRKAGDAKQRSGLSSFEEIAREWHEHNRSGWTVEHAGAVLRRLEANLLPYLGPRPTRLEQRYD
jgi:Arm DNA-binding domain